MNKPQLFGVLVAAAPVLAMGWAGVATATPISTGPVPLGTREVTELTGFTSPSGNIGCYIDPSYVRCDIRERDWSPPPRPASCPDMTGYGQGVEVNVGKPATFVCAGDTALGGGDPLAYGDTIVAGSIECTSLPEGMRCWDFQYGGEFTISREGYQLA